MEFEIAKLLNCTAHDKERLRSLLEEYVFESDSDTDDAEDDSCDTLTQIDDESVEYDMRRNDLDIILDDTKENAEIVVEVEDELEKVKKFWCV